MSVEERSERCPDGGYCHGSEMWVGSTPCAGGDCYRVRVSGPLSGVYPGDRWPEVFCPFAGDGRCPSEPRCVSPRERVCVNGFEDE